MVRNWIIIFYCINYMYDKIDTPNYNDDKTNNNQNFL